MRRIHGNTMVRRLLVSNEVSGYKRYSPTVIKPSAADLANGIRVMGGESYTIPSTSSQVFVTCYYEVEARNWLVTYTVGLNPSTKIAAPSGGETIDAEARTTLARILTTLEANGLSLRS